jgi:hypothetical protein
MAAHPVVVVDDELLEKLPEPFKADPRYQKGASLELVPLASSQPRTSPDEVIRRWESLRGLLAHSDFDPNAALQEEKQRELAEEANWTHR